MTHTTGEVLDTVGFVRTAAWTDRVLSLASSYFMSPLLHEAVEELRASLVSNLARATAENWTAQELVEHLPAAKDVKIVVEQANGWMRRIRSINGWIPDPDAVFEAGAHSLGRRSARIHKVDREAFIARANSARC